MNHEPETLIILKLMTSNTIPRSEQIAIAAFVDRDYSVTAVWERVAAPGKAAFEQARQAAINRLVETLRGRGVTLNGLD